MLEKSDLMAIENLLDKKLDQRFAGFDKSMDKKLDERFAEQDRKIDEKLEQRFAEQDRKIDEKLEQRFAEQGRKIDEKLEQRFAKYDKSMDKKFAKIKKMDLFLVDEIERNRNILEIQMDRMQQDMDEVKSEIRQLYRITGVENERMDMEIEELRQNDLELSDRVTRLENRAMA